MPAKLYGAGPLFHLSQWLYKSHSQTVYLTLIREIHSRKRTKSWFRHFMHAKHVIQSLIFGHSVRILAAMLFLPPLIMLAGYFAINRVPRVVSPALKGWHLQLSETECPICPKQGYPQRQEANRATWMEERNRQVRKTDSKSPSEMEQTRSPSSLGPAAILLT